MTDLVRYAVIGQPIAHSRSPFIHGAFARQTGQPVHYEAIEVAPSELAASLAALHAQGFEGLNVTLPHKQAVVALCESVSPRAQRAGAVNTLSRTASGWIGDNTDGQGLVQDLADQGFLVTGKQVLILGAGGAARGLLEPLLALNPASLTISNRNPWKPEELAESFKPLGEVTPRTHLSLKGDRYDLIIHATSAGHQGQMTRIPGQILAAGGQCYDLSYGAAAAPFLAWAQSQGAVQCADGLGMLVGQAAVAFALWRGVAPQTASVLASLRAPEPTGEALKIRHPHPRTAGQD